MNSSMMDSYLLVVFVNNSQNYDHVSHKQCDFLLQRQWCHLEKIWKAAESVTGINTGIEKANIHSNENYSNCA